MTVESKGGGIAMTAAFRTGSGLYAGRPSGAAGGNGSAGYFRRVSAAGPEAMYKPGDRVVYTATKHSAHPGRRAEAVEPEPHGEGYSYNVKKYWLVLDVQPDGRLKVVTRRGKHRVLPTSDPRLRPARWWESVFQRGRFPSPPVPGDPNSVEEHDEPRA